MHDCRDSLRGVFGTSTPTIRFSPVRHTIHPDQNIGIPTCLVCGSLRGRS